MFAVFAALDYAPPAAPAPPDLGGLVLRLVAMTAVLIALCAVVFWFARRANRPADGTGEGGGRMKLEGTLTLDRVCAVHIITVDGQSVAVTTDATGLRSIVVLSEPFDAALEAAAAPAESPDDVSQLLQGFIRGGDRPRVHLETALRDNQP